ncbi:MAG: hypothetical protein EP329_17725, partial [Deltaproteobacteria bacterium]
MGEASFTPSRTARRLASAAIAALAVFTLIGSTPAQARVQKKTVLLIGDSNIFGHLGKALQADLEAEGYRVVRRG